MARLLRPVMKIMSTMPAAAASSTAYWISGLSTMGSISLGLALVTGRKRLPRPATGKTALLTLPNAMDELPELLFVEHRHVEFLGTRKLAARVGAGDDVVGLFAYAAGDLPSAALDELLCLVTRKRWQRTRQHEGQPDERTGGRRTFGRRFRPMYPRGAKLGNDFAVMPFAEELTDALRQDWTDVGHFEQRLFVGVDKGLELAEMRGEILGGGFADVTDSQRENEPRKRCCPTPVNRRHDVCRGLLRHPLQLGKCRHAELVQVGRRVNDAGIDELIDQLVSQAFDVHRPTVGKVQQRLLAL